jgi:hypothetical protein
MIQTLISFPGRNFSSRTGSYGPIIFLVSLRISISSSRLWTMLFCVIPKLKSPELGFTVEGTRAKVLKNLDPQQQGPL